MILGNTLGGHDFSNFIKNALEMREAEILTKNDLQIEISERGILCLKLYQNSRTCP